MAWLYGVFVELFGRKREPRTILRVGVYWSDFPLHFVKGNLTSGRQPAKSCEAHVSARIIRQTHRITMPLLSTYSPGLREHVRYPFHVAMTSKTYSIRLWNFFSQFHFYNCFIKDSFHLETNPKISTSKTTTPPKTLKMWGVPILTLNHDYWSNQKTVKCFQKKNRFVVQKKICIP